MIRYHSLYPWHACGAYADLENDKDRKTKEWVLRFNKYAPTPPRYMQLQRHATLS